MHPRLRNLLLATTPLLAFGLTQATAGPEGASVVGGGATIQGQGGPAVIVNQSTSSAVINWNTFNIRANESVRFNQPSASSVALNRVVGGLGYQGIFGLGAWVVWTGVQDTSRLAGMGFWVQKLG